MSSIDSFVQGGSGIAQFIDQYFRTKEANKEIAKLMENYPKWEISQGYKDSLATSQQLASGKTPGYDIALGNIEKSFARGTDAAREGALGSSQYMDTIAKLGEQSLDAKSKLDMLSQQYQAQAKQNLAEAQYKYGDLQAQQWNQNINRLWNLKMQQQEAKKAYGIQGMYAGMDTFLGSSEKFASSMGGGDLSSMFG